MYNVSGTDPRIRTKLSRIHNSELEFLKSLWGLGTEEE
jgi:hypothetical protein